MRAKSDVSRSSVYVVIHAIVFPHFDNPRLRQQEQFRTMQDKQSRPEKVYANIFLLHITSCD
jgi:hypothetical protein